MKNKSVIIFSFLTFLVGASLILTKNTSSRKIASNLYPEESYSEEDWKRLNPSQIAGELYSEIYSCKKHYKKEKKYLDCIDEATNTFYNDYESIDD